MIQIWSTTYYIAHVCFLLLWHSLSGLGVGDLLVDGGRLHLLQRTHDAVLLAPMGLNQWVHPVRVEHDVVRRHEQHPAHRTLKKKEREREREREEKWDMGMGKKQ